MCKRSIVGKQKFDIPGICKNKQQPSQITLVIEKPDEKILHAREG